MRKINISVAQISIASHLKTPIKINVRREEGRSSVEHETCQENQYYSERSERILSSEDAYETAPLNSNLHRKYWIARRKFIDSWVENFVERKKNTFFLGQKKTLMYPFPRTY